MENSIPSASMPVTDRIVIGITGWQRVKGCNDPACVNNHGTDRLYSVLVRHDDFSAIRYIIPSDWDQLMAAVTGGALQHAGIGPGRYDFGATVTVIIHDDSSVTMRHPLDEHDRNSTRIAFSADEWRTFVARADTGELSVASLLAAAAVRTQPAG